MRKKTSKHFDSTANNFNNKNSTSASWGARLRNLRNSISEHRRSSNFDAWSRSIWQLGSWWLEIAGEEAAGVVLELLEEFKREKARKRGDLVIPTVCGDTFLDNLLGKCLVRITWDLFLNFFCNFRRYWERMNLLWRFVKRL